MRLFMRVLFITLLTLLESTQNNQRAPVGQFSGNNQGKSSLLKSLSVTFATKSRCIMNLFPSLVIHLCLSYLSDDLAHVLNHHLICCYRLHCKQAPLMDVTPAETNPFLSELIQDNMSFHDRIHLLLTQILT